MIKEYYLLTKPGIIRGNAITAIAGFLLASKGDIDPELLVALVLGVSLVMASACVYNNYLDRQIDLKMERTKKRALVTGSISPQSAIRFATVLGVLGFTILTVFTNIITVLVGVIGFVDYIVLYGITKRTSVHGTIVGSISGATPPVAGYTAVTNQFDVGALLLFLILVFWQMPHFYAIAIYRIKDYKAASIPVWPIVKGMRSTKIQIVLYMIGFIVVTTLLTIYRYTGYTYLIAMLILGCIWLTKGINGFKSKNNTRWASNIFSFSLVVLLSFSILISLENILP